MSLFPKKVEYPFKNHPKMNEPLNVNVQFAIGFEPVKNEDLQSPIAHPDKTNTAQLRKLADVVLQRLQIGPRFPESSVILPSMPSARRCLWSEGGEQGHERRTQDILHTPYLNRCMFVQMD